VELKKNPLPKET